MQYHQYTAEDFVADPYFRRWILNPDQQTRDFWNQWLNEHPNKRIEVEDAKSILASVRFNYYQASQEDLKEVWSAIESRNQKSSSTAPKRQLSRRLGRYSVWLKVAASVGVIAAFLFLYSQSEKLETYATAFGETKTIVLPDGSEVVLNANSELRYEKDWESDQKREVWLDGEAYFSVAHRENQQFLVYVTDAVKVEVLGTEFNVKERREVAQVVLQKGKVELTVQKGLDKPQILSMQPGELVEFSEKNQVLSKIQVNPEQYASWRNHKMEFQDTSLGDIARQLEDLYGVSITIKDDNLANTQLTGAFPTHDLDMILISLRTIANIQIEREGENIEFK